MDKKTLTFEIQSDDKKKMVPPRWRAAETENTECPQCHKMMVVVLGHGKILYGICGRCNQYFLP